MDIYILENSCFDLKKNKFDIYYKIENKIEKEKCIKIEDNLKEFIPYEYLNPIQTIFFKYYQEGNSIVSTPTSSGKTGIIYITFYKNYQKNKDFKFIYTAPTKALIEEKFNEFSLYFKNLFKDEKKYVDIKTGDYFTKKIDKDSLLITTTFDSLAIALRNNLEWVQNRNLIIIDEVHSFINNMGKFVPEILAISLEKNIPLILLSATLPIIKDLKNYIQSNLNIISNFRPVKLNKYYLHLTKDNIERSFLKKMKELNITKANDIYILYVLNQAYNRALLKEKVIIFIWSKKLGWEFLKYSPLLNLKIFNKTINFDQKLNENTENNSIEKEDKKNNLNQIEIAFHNADIPYEERKEIKEEFKKEESSLRILIPTQTLALGVNLPADTAYINIKAFYDDYFNINLLPSNLDIIQEEGRVGRFGLKEEGFSFRTTWSVPYNIRKNIDYYIDNFDSKLFIKKYINNSSIYNNIFLLILSSLKIFKLEILYLKNIKKF
ncbi:MAG: DEAD/DEAH box helicase [bacterium]